MTNSLTIALLCVAIPAWAETVGEAFGKPVSEAEVAHHVKTAQLFSRSGKTEPTGEEARAEAWRNLVFLKEAERLGIQVPKEELELELKRLLQEKGIEHGTPAYQGWVRLTLREEPAVFERRLEELLKINRLMAQKMRAPVEVSEEEIRQKFLNQYNNFESEYIRFDSRDEAEAFLNRVRKNRVLWKETFDRKKTEEGQKGAAWINIMAIEALVDLWKMPREDAYRMMEAEPGDFVAARNIYGECVYRLLFKQTADPKQLDSKMQDYYRNALTQAKRQESAKGYFNDLIRRAGVRDFRAERKQEEEKGKMAAKIEELKKKSLVRLETSQGEIRVRLFPESAPKACENFITLVERGYFNGLIFHRVIRGFMIQGGDPTGTGSGGSSVWGRPFEDEFSDQLLFSRPGLLAMANAGPNTNQSQFFITTVPTPHLNRKHTIFGEVAEGMEVVRKIESAPTGSQDRPLEPQKILKAVVEPATVS